MLRRNSNASMWFCALTRAGRTACLCCEFSTSSASRSCRQAILLLSTHLRIFFSWLTPSREILSWMTLMTAMRRKRKVEEVGERGCLQASTVKTGVAAMVRG